MKLFLPCVYAFLACAAFCVVFELRRWRYILPACFTGAVSWLVYLALPEGNVAVRCFVATIVVSALAELLARLLKAPATIFLVIGIIPLVPGGGLYYTMDYLLDKNFPMFSQVGLQTASTAAAIAVGASMVTSMVRMFTWRKRPQKDT